MAIIGIGIDWLENRRMERELARAGWQAGDGIFTAEEIAACYADRSPVRQYSACFAAKEAVMKALGVEISDLGNFREAEVHRRSGGQYGLRLHHRLRARSEQMGVRDIWLSIAFATRYTGAIVVLEG